MLLDVAGDAPGAYRHFERSLRLFDQLGTGHAVVGQAGLLARPADRMGQPELAAQWRSFVQGRTGRSTHDDYDGSVLAAISNQVGLDARREGDLERAKQAHLEARAWYAEIGVTYGAAFTESCLGFLATDLGDHAGAATHHARALDDAEALGDLAALALALEGAASTFSDGEARWAAEVLGAARALREATDRAPDAHTVDLDAVEHRARAELGDEAYDTAVRRGAARRRAETVAAVRAARCR